MIVPLRDTRIWRRQPGAEGASGQAQQLPSVLPERFGMHACRALRASLEMHSVNGFSSKQVRPLRPPGIEGYNANATGEKALPDGIQERHMLA